MDGTGAPNDHPLLDALAVGVLVVGDGRTVEWSNARAIDLLDSTADTLVGCRLEDLVDPVDAPVLRRDLARTFGGAGPCSLRAPSVASGRQLLVSLVPCPAPGRPVSSVGSVVVTVQDVTSVLGSDPMVAAMRSVLDRMDGLVGITDDRANVMYLNPRGGELLGHGDAPGRLAHVRTTEIFGADAFALYYEEIRPTLLAGGSWSGRVPVLGEAGDVVELWVELWGGTADDEAGDPTVEWLVARAAEDRPGETAADLAYRANHDPLTGLVNRSLFLDRLRLALLRRDRAHHPVTVAFLDLDGFKAINDELGHAAGDDVLQEVAVRLTECLRPVDTVARWGGDEFVVLCEDMGGEELEERVSWAVGSKPFAVPGDEVELAVTVGWVTSPPGPSVAEELLAAADAAMYRQKRSRS